MVRSTDVKVVAEGIRLYDRQMYKLTSRFPLMIAVFSSNQYCCPRRKAVVSGVGQDNKGRQNNRRNQRHNLVRKGEQHRWLGK